MCKERYPLSFFFSFVLTGLGAVMIMSVLSLLLYSDVYITIVRERTYAKKEKGRQQREAI